MKSLNTLFQRILPAAFALLLLCGALSCRWEQAGNPVHEDQRRTRTHFSVVVDDIQNMVQTKSVLTDGQIETKITSLTVAVYSSDGSLVEKKYLTSGFNDIQYLLEFDETFTVYAVANMGDMRASFPAAITGDTSLEGFIYSIPGYTSGDACINTRGIPMAGKLVYTVGGDNAGGEGQIVMTRLLAKLNVSLQCHWPGTITSVKVKNLNARLKPFGNSAAASASDLLAEEEVEIPDTPVGSGSFVFYIPENKLGSVDGITSSEGKTRDDTGASNPVNAKADIATYLEVTVAGKTDFGADGSIRYRSYLGGNKTSDFNIIRNNRYVWTLEYEPDGLVHNDWKHENGMSWSRYTFTRSWPDYLYLNQSDNFVTYVHANNYVNGVLAPATSPDPENLPSGVEFNWEISPAGRITIDDPGRPRYTYFPMTGANPGSTLVKQTVYDGFEDNTYEKNVPVLNMSRQLFLRTPAGDYYENDWRNPSILVPYGSVWEVSLGMKKTTSAGTQVICPIVCGQDNNTGFILQYGPLANTEVLDVHTYHSGDIGKPATGTLTFDKKGSSTNVYAHTFYKDYEDNTQSVVARFYYTVSDVDTELLSIEADKESALISSYNGKISLEGFSTAIHNGASGVKTDVTHNGSYEWYVSSGNGSVSYDSGTGRQVVTSPVAGTVTVTLRKTADPSISVSKTLTFNNKTEYRLGVSPSSVTVEVGDQIKLSDFTFLKELWVNDVKQSSENKNSGVYWGYNDYTEDSPYITFNYSSSIFTAEAEGNAHIKAYTYDSTIDYDHREVLINVTVDNAPADVWTVAVSPSSASKRVGETQQYTAVVKKNGTAQSVSASNITWDVSAGGSYASVSSTGLATATAPGTATIRARYSDGDASHNCSGTATLNVNSADYSVTISPSAGVDLILGKKTTQSYSASATKNGSAATDGTFEWSLSSGAPCSLSATTGSSTTVQSPTAAAQTVTLTASYKVGTQSKASASVTFKIYNNSLSLSLDKTSIAVNGNAQATATYRTFDGGTPTETNVTSSATFKAYTAATGTTESDKVTISGSTITAASAGTCYIEATYSTGGYSYTCDRVALTISNNPLILDYSSAGTPSVVAQRGLLQVNGLDDNSATVEFNVTSGSDKVRLAQSGKNTYVGLLGAGSYTITATASNGQVGTYSGTISAPTISLNATDFYANPDGTVIHTGTDGLSSSALSVVYKNGATELVTTTGETATGAYLQSSLYGELLDLQYSSSDSRVHAGSDGIYAADVYEAGNSTTISTVAITPKMASTGVSGVGLNVKGVNPFSSWGGTVTAMPDEDDFGLINKYRGYAAHSYDTHEFEKPRIAATGGQCGIELFRNGSILTTTAIRACFSSSYSAAQLKWTTSYQLSEAALSEHVAGLIELKGYVRNSRSNNCMYKDGAKFGVYVNGAIGAKMSGIGTTEVTISTAFAGNEADYGFGLIGTTRLIGTLYSNGDPFGYISNTSVVDIPEDGSLINSRVYTLRREGATLDSADTIMEAEKPRFEFLSVGTIGVFKEDGLGGFYYLRPSGTPTVEDGSHGYYKLWLLESLDGTNLSGPKQGWILD